MGQRWARLEAHDKQQYIDKAARVRKQMHARPMREPTNGHSPTRERAGVQVF